MYYTLGFYPELGPELEAAIVAIRKEHDPTFSLAGPHVTVMFPVPDQVGESNLVKHIERVLRASKPFDIRLGGFHRSRDHWLFLTLAEGREQVKKLHGSLYTGILSAYRRNDIEFVPHLGLGLFIREGCPYDWDHPRETDFDRERYEKALRQAKGLPLGPGFRVERLNMSCIPDEVIEWATGRRTVFPEGSKLLNKREFPLGAG